MIKISEGALGLQDIYSKDVQKLDSVDHIAELQQVGTVVAEKLVEQNHFINFN